jgi:hypothetical protein
LLARLRWTFAGRRLSQVSPWQRQLDGPSLVAIAWPVERAPHVYGGPEDVWKVVEAAVPCAEGYRVIWVWNSLMAWHDADLPEVCPIVVLAITERAARSSGEAFSLLQLGRSCHNRRCVQAARRAVSGRVSVDGVLSPTGLFPVRQTSTFLCPHHRLADPLVGVEWDDWGFPGDPHLGGRTPPETCGERRGERDAAA